MNALKKNGVVCMRIENKKGVNILLWWFKNTLSFYSRMELHLDNINEGKKNPKIKKLELVKILRGKLWVHEVWM